MTAYAELVGLFTTALLAATILPFPSEALFAALVAAGNWSTVSLLVVATLGNTLGSVLNWWLGTYAAKLQGTRWFPVSPAKLETARASYHRWGFWSLLLSWVPIIGDGLTVAAGLMREPLWRFTVIVGIGKCLRYFAVALAVHEML
jgi:membrane protein YqaA with SNARE-associated domain